MANSEAYETETDGSRARAPGRGAPGGSSDRVRSVPSMSTPLRALVVDDSEDDVALVLRVLRRGGYAVEHIRVDTAEDMAAVIEQGIWDVILSDFDMPDFDMLSALALRNERCPDVPFIIISGRIGEDAIVTAMKRGAQEYVLKSDLSRLVPALQRSIREMATLAERRRAEEALRASEERFALAVRGSRDGLWDWNIVTGEVYYSPRFKEILGFEEHEFQGGISEFTSLVHPDDLGTVSVNLRAHLEEHAPYNVECRVRNKQGELLWIFTRGQALWNADGKAIRMAGSLTDLTDRKRAEEELRQNIEVIQQQLAVIQQQREEIQVLRTPIIQVWEGVLMTPVLGVLDRDRAASLMELLLGAVVETRSRQVILDLTAVEKIDAATANHVMKLVHAVELLGARGIVVGIQPMVAATIVSAGIDLSRVTTLANLREALLFCMHRRPGGPSRSPERSRALLAVSPASHPARQGVR